MINLLLSTFPFHSFLNKPRICMYVQNKRARVVGAVVRRGCMLGQIFDVMRPFRALVLEKFVD